ncbi:MAG TPA: trypsin-like peptidase domain-containing protein [Candidatus Sulfotelmatobacter sp.]|jgi:S1-C subfamily serine protease|nr:trypsin-like peptidase domain-containing protein [Candidatus Sulfotelmatobacter sp.]
MSPVSRKNDTHPVRIILIALVLLAGAYWAGARWGPRGPQRVEAVPLGSNSKSADNASLVQRDAALTDDESINVRVYRQAAPAVANILTKATEYDFFMDPVPVEGAGSGFIIDVKGYILTNNHVVEGAQSIEVVLSDQSRYPAKVIGSDPRNDVALIKIEPKNKPLVALPLGDSTSIQVGQKVLAIGNPFGFQSTLTTGVVSAIGRTVQTSQTTFIDEAIQTDAAINRGNSGGPLINSHGQVIGINSAIYTPSGTTAGIGFAIPINTAKRIAHDLMTDGRVHQAFLGVDSYAVGGGLAEALDLPVQEGLLVQTVSRGGPAAQAGLHGGDRIAQLGMRRFYAGGDVIVAIDGQKIATQLDVNLVLNRKRPGDSVTVTVYRGGKKLDIPVKLGERPRA